MKATVKTYRYYPSTPGYVSSGHKKHDIPKNAVAGGHGTYVLAGDPPKVLVGYEAENGQTGSVNMYGTIKSNSSRRITEKYVDSLMIGVIGQEIDTDKAVSDIIHLMAPRLQ